jgi:hypothetical protein
MNINLTARGNIGGVPLDVTIQNTYGSDTNPLAIRIENASLHVSLDSAGIESVRLIWLGQVLAALAANPEMVRSRSRGGARASEIATLAHEIVETAIQQRHQIDTVKKALSELPKPQTAQSSP